uniref:Uncharacterized protein n=1 Tax=Eucampia antarctica TaxID=49252 RepID=A0A7S2VYJ2_9STRA|mmetsp:Transcript_10640/g.10192  ORF Transcript_10640/g.10192 Transcript_10640/m.10192 type:complete len:292 (+) Transcript_10640:154-1029(+)|eukprot:CAMPEP_0197825646 /NCGR_PEP_ID=MMETSP1437-20131217/2696_1 /TAXON_ID=49252 ORGANISM="Eucampia antarctica, Strain CCMP1452" /NCGR_SAMPLE_ID=MMETSP1437 /ASSEMBLY_ACC=CAM_ASM_001096 /LENGTH=291 /DNA_ID=CAMNT_0043425737 /DNA_START=106 /DNA_END=981 /DNA_ORIENTATION=+
MNNNQGGYPQRAVIPNAGDMGSIVVRGVTNFARKHKVISGSYILGVLVLLIFTTGTKLTLQQRQQYNSIMNTIDLKAEYDASDRYGRAAHAYQSSKGWFTCDGLCQRNKRRMEAVKQDLDEVRAEGNARMSDAKSKAGLFSEVGVAEVKDSFWDYFHKGKQFAKRRSMWDALFMGMRSMGRDENILEYCLKLLLQVLINFSLGLIGALFIFVWGLWTIVNSYQPDPLTAAAFFVGATCAGFAFVSTYLFLIYGAAAGSVYGLAKVVESNARLQNGRRPQNNNNGMNRPHIH